MAQNTYAAAQGANLVIGTATKFLFRTLLQSVGDPAPIIPQLFFQKNGGGGFIAVPVGATTGGTTPVVETADAQESGDNNTTPTSPWPVTRKTASTGDLIVMVIAWDDSVNNTGVTPANGPNGETWNQIGAVQASASTEIRMTAYWTVATGAWSAGSISVTPNANEQWTACMFRVPAGEFDPDTPIGAADTAGSAATNETTINSPALTTGPTDYNGRLIFCAAADSDPQTSLKAGYTQITNTDRGNVSLSVNSRDTAVGNSESLAAGDGTQTIASDSWASLAFVIRPPQVNNEVYVVDSTNVTNGEATTERMGTGSPSIGPFQAGKIWDTANGSDELNLADLHITELAWCLQGAAAADGNFYELAVQDGDTPLDNYPTSYPRVTFNDSTGTAIDAAVDALTITELAATITLAKTVAAAVDALSIAERQASIQLAKNITGANDALVITERQAAITLSKTVQAAADALLISEQAAAVSIGVTIGAAADALVIGELQAAIALAKTVAAALDTLTITERQASVQLGKAIAAGLDTLTITELAATVTLAKIVAAAVDALTITEYGASINSGTGLQASADALVIAEHAATVALARNIAAAVDALLISEQTATVQINKAVQAAVDALLISEHSATITLAKAIAASLDTLTITERQATVGLGSGVQAETDALVITEQQAGITLAKSVAASADALVITERQAAISLAKTVAATVDTLAITERQATVALAKTVVAAVDALQLTEYQATIDATVAIIYTVARRFMAIAPERHFTAKAPEKRHTPTGPGKRFTLQ